MTRPNSVPLVTLGIVIALFLDTFTDLPRWEIFSVFLAISFVGVTHAIWRRNR